ncbi:Alpha-2-macroglobulin OS=Castellaniella defragrans OX=75697 GN=HNR28_001586 PE=3 SV=1 [Castellaniella defragrans]
MVGLPLAQPGLHVIEVASPRLGAALLSTKDHASRDTMYVRSAVLVTNLAVHVKTGRDDTLVWVTSLDKGLPVADAGVAVFTCDGKPLQSGKTDAQGLWHSMEPVPSEQLCEDTGQSGVFVTARVPADHPAAHGAADFSFAWSTWNQGIEPWRFDVPYSRSATPDWVAHAVMDRTLLHTGETVSMKLFVRTLTRDGVRNPAATCPARPAGSCLASKVQIVHEGSGDSVDVPVRWQLSPTGGLYALLSYAIPQTAHLGRYSVSLSASESAKDSEGSDDTWVPQLEAGAFRVESFTLPELTGSLKISGEPPQGPPEGSSTAEHASGTIPPGVNPSPAKGLIAPSQVRADLQLAWQSGGPARDFPATLSALSEPLTPSFQSYPDYTFGVPQDLESGGHAAASR